MDLAAGVPRPQYAQRVVGRSLRTGAPRRVRLGRGRVGLFRDAAGEVVRREAEPDAEKQEDERDEVADVEVPGEESEPRIGNPYTGVPANSLSPPSKTRGTPASALPTAYAVRVEGSDGTCRWTNSRMGERRVSGLM